MWLGEIGGRSCYGEIHPFLDVMAECE
jgi:hypothetical protein